MSAPFLFDTCAQADTFALSDGYLGRGAALEEKAALVMRAIGAPIWIETIRAMGAEPTPIVPAK